jgi:hypothetical protein
MTDKIKKEPRKRKQNKYYKRNEKLDARLVENLGAIGCTYEEVCTVLDISTGRFGSQRLRDPELVAAIKKGASRLKISIRRAQVHKAVEEKNTTMLIWLGKNILGQRDIPLDKEEQEDVTWIYRQLLSDGSMMVFPEGVDPIDVYNKKFGDEKEDAGK